MKKKLPKKAFTLLELLIVIAILVILVATSFTIRGAIIGDTLLSTQTREIVESLKLAQTRSIARYKDSQWGVYFSHNSTSTDRWIIFKGSNYSARDAAYDLIITLPTPLTFTNISLNGGGSEITFTKVNGTTSQYGSLKLTSSQGNSNTISVSAKGLVDAP